MKLLIRHGRLVDPVSGIGGVMDILVDEDGTIAGIGSNLPDTADRIIDADGLVVCAGLVDMHVHLREPGFEYKETIDSGARAAAYGGFTSIACMPNTDPVIDSSEMIQFVREKGRAACGVNVFPIGAVTVGQQGGALTDFAALKQAGAVALSDDGVPVQHANIVRDGLIMGAMHGLTLLSHCEDADMVKNYAVNEGRISRQLRLEGRPAIAEEIMIARDAMLAEETGGALHICHVSTARSVALVRRFKKKGVQITCETCPHYFTLTEDAVLEKGSLARVNPPLRTQQDVDGIIAGLKDGTIDVIATDHAPHSEEEKARTLAEAPSGIAGLETALALSLTHLYHTGLLTLSDLLRKMTINPACILRVNKGRLAVGSDADIVVFDPDEAWRIDPARFIGKGHNTPFGGETVKGKVKYTIAGGEIIYSEKEAPDYVI
ncbi:MAG: dihydroorotase [Oscillospiraceae bacterium]|nr:dihydroorotase [Oscillospiraceae bacterium]